VYYDTNTPRILIEGFTGAGLTSRLPVSAEV
jgi:hypothetical protein